VHTRSETELTSRSTMRPSFGRRRLIALLFWLVLLSGYQLYAWRSGLSPREAAEHLIHLMTFDAAGALIYVAFYASSRLVFFPPTLLTIASGFVFGPVWGVFLAVLGSSAAAVVSYSMGHHFGQGLLGPEKGTGTLGRYTERMREEGFEAVLLLRLVYAPFDPVSILAGSLGISWRRFVLATFVGSLPPILSLVLFGASLETDFTGGGFRLNPWTLIISMLLFAASLLLSRYLKSRASPEKGSDRTSGWRAPRDTP
jgi:uncharacterized membrane protein YdjX (TVP38/TMEM64 family)